MKVIGAIIAGVLITAIFACIIAYYLGLLAAAVIGFNLLFGTTISPLTGVVLGLSAWVIVVAAKVLLGGGADE